MNLNLNLSIQQNAHQYLWNMNLNINLSIQQDAFENIFC